MAIVYNLFNIVGNINNLTESKLLEVKVPIAFLVTAGFSSPRDGR